MSEQLQIWKATQQETGFVVEGPIVDQVVAALWRKMMKFFAEKLATGELKPDDLKKYTISVSSFVMTKKENRP